MTDLIERAKVLALAGDFSPDDLGGDIGTMSLRNPDGPELLSIVQSLSERIAVLERANDKLAKWLYEACGGFPVSEEAFAAVAADLPVIAREMSRPFEGRPLAEFRAEIEEKLASLIKEGSK